MTPAILKKLEEMKPSEYDVLVPARNAEKLEKALRIAVEKLELVYQKTGDPTSCVWSGEALYEIAEALGVGE